RPRSARSRPASARVCASSVWSHTTGTPQPPARVTAAAVSSTVPPSAGYVGRPAADRPVQYTVMPAAPSATAIPLPTPRLAPVTNATSSATWTGWHRGTTRTSDRQPPAHRGAQRGEVGAVLVPLRDRVQR